MLLNSIVNLNYDENSIEIIVVKDPGDSLVHDVVKEICLNHNFKDVKILDLYENSATKAWNLGILNSSGELVLVLPDDILLHPDTLKKAIQHFEADPNVVAVTFPAVRPKPTLIDKIHFGKFLGIVCDSYVLLPITIFKRKKIIEIGLYREDMGPPYTIHEDWELGSRIRRKGFKVIVDGTLLQIHEPLTKACESSMHAQIMRSNVNYVKRLFRNLINYVNVYLNRNWRTFFIVMKSSPLPQKLEYAIYFVIPWILVALLLASPVYALLYIALLITVTTLYSILKGYYKVFGFGERMLYPILLLLIRVLRTNLAMAGYLKNLLTIKLGRRF